MGFRDLGFRPRRPLAVLLGVLTGLGIAAAGWPPAGTLWPVAAVLLGAALAADLWWLARLPLPLVHRRIRRTLPQGVWSRVELTVGNRARSPLRLAVHDLHPSEMEVRHLPRELRLGARERQRIDYELRPPRRGDFAFPGCDLCLVSPLGLWSRRRSLPLSGEIRVFPNFGEISQYTLLATSDRLSQIGVRVRRRRGIGAEFHQLREYRRGDSPRQIDWKASAKVRKLISREYQDERDQRVLFLLDSGRRMRHADGGRGHLDEALNALLLLAYVAVRQGDAVGLMTYGGPKRWFAPRKGADTVNRLLAAVYDLQPTLEAADPLMAARELLQALDRRALVVVLTNSRDEDNRELETAIRLLRRRHLVVLADLRERALDAALEAPVADRETALRFHAVQDYLETRRRHHERLHHSGAYVLDLLPSQLPVALVNQYLDIKRAGTL
jgi:uncharacterized protein (DUF58 family)